MLICLLAAVIWFLDYNRRGSTASTHPFADIKWDSVRQLTVDREGLSVEFVKKNKDWFIKSPVRTRVADGVVEKILSVLESVKCVETITTEQMQNRSLRLTDCMS